MLYFLAISLHPNLTPLLWSQPLKKIRGQFGYITGGIFYPVALPTIIKHKYLSLLQMPPIGLLYTTALLQMVLLNISILILLLLFRQKFQRERVSLRLAPAHRGLLLFKKVQLSFGIFFFFTWDHYVRTKTLEILLLSKRQKRKILCDHKFLGLCIAVVKSTHWQYLPPGSLKRIGKCNSQRIYHSIFQHCHKENRRRFQGF